MGKYSFTCEYCGNDCGYTCERAEREVPFREGVEVAKEYIEQIAEIKTVLQEWLDDDRADDRDYLLMLINILDMGKHAHVKKDEEADSTPAPEPCLNI